MGSKNIETKSMVRLCQNKSGEPNTNEKKFSLENQGKVLEKINAISNQAFWVRVEIFICFSTTERRSTELKQQQRNEMSPNRKLHDANKKLNIREMPSHSSKMHKRALADFGFAYSQISSISVKMSE